MAVQLGEKDGGGSHIEELLRQIQESNTDKAFWRKFLLPIASNSDTYKPEIMVHLHLALEVKMPSLTISTSVFKVFFYCDYKQPLENTQPIR